MSGKLTATSDHEKTPAGQAMAKPRRRVKAGTDGGPAITRERERANADADAVARDEQDRAEALLTIDDDAEAAAEKRAARGKRNTPVSAARAAKADAKLTAKGHAFTREWMDKTGADLPVGARVVEPCAGVVKSRCTRPENDGRRTPMVGILTDEPCLVKGRNVKVPTFPASEVLLAKETPARKRRAKAASDDKAIAAGKAGKR
jgi:hypothetical protein